MDRKDLENRFTYHPPEGEKQRRKYEDIRYMVRSTAEAINVLCPESREKSLAITRLEEAVFWANASIARNAGDWQAAAAPLGPETLDRVAQDLARMDPGEPTAVMKDEAGVLEKAAASEPAASEKADPE